MPGLRGSRWSIRSVLFLVLLLPAWALGIVRGGRITAHIGQVPPFFGDDLARFERLRPRLAASERAFLLLDRPSGLASAERFFAAQYTLAPAVLSLALDVERVIGRDWSGESRLVLCAFDDAGRLNDALARLAAAAAERHATFVAEPIDGVLTVVRLGGN